MDLLYIDDDLDDLEFFADAVKTIDPNCSCILTTNGEEGLSMLATMKPDFIFLDMNMPRLDGRKILKAIRENRLYDRIKVCIYSTSITSSESEVYKKIGANYCIKKPSSFEELKRVLRKTFELDEGSLTHTGGRQRVNNLRSSS